MSVVLGSGHVSKTRVRHRCWHCGKFIEKGEPCHWQTNTTDGLVTVYWHDLCHLSIGWEDYE